MTRIAVIPEGEVNLIVQKLDAIERRLKEKSNGIPEFVDNAKLCEILGISKRTSQSWRDKGLIKFSQIGHKIYYSREDVIHLLDINKF